MDTSLKILSGKQIAIDITEALREKVKKYIRKPRLDIFLIGDRQESAKYVSLKEKKGKEIGVDVVVHRYTDTVTEEELIQEIGILNENSEVTGIMVQLPLAKNFNQKNILNRINPDKDVDGLTEENLSRLENKNERAFLSATARAIDTLLASYNVEIKDKNIAIIGSSIEVGIPTSINLKNKGGRVVLCDENTKDIKMKTGVADIVITATGVPNLINKEYLNKGCIVIDVGYTLKEGLILGDVDIDDVKDYISAVSPVPGGVGPLTVVSLFSNLLKAYIQNEK